MRTLVFDIEADGLLPALTKLHCLVIRDGGKQYKFHDDPDIERDGTIIDGLRMMSQADVLVGHNIIGYDIPAIRKLYPGFKYNKLHDTFILSQLFFANEMERHSLDAWGKVFGVPKVQHNEWLNFSREMLHRCSVDVDITAGLWRSCESELASHDWQRAVQIEYQTYLTYSKHMTHWFMDTDKLEQYIDQLQVMLNEKTEQLSKLAPIQIIPHEKEVKAFLKNNLISERARAWAGDNVVGDFCKVEFEPTNLNSSTQLVKWLLDLGWKPDTWNYQTNKYGKPVKGPDGKPIITSPSLRDSSYYGVPDHIRDAIISRNEVRHRLSVLKGWQEKVYDGNKIDTFAFTCGTNTGRFRHHGIVNVPKVDGPFFGKEMRSLFVAPEGYVLVGCDAAQLEARIEGHYSYPYDGGEYADFLLSQDVHEFNAKSWGISRQEAKGPGYALAYQCGPEKIDQLLGCGIQQARYIHKKYWEDRPALKDLIADLNRALVGRGQARWTKFHETSDNYELTTVLPHVAYDPKGQSRNNDFKAPKLDLSTKPWIRGIDGRKIFVRSAHSLKNALIQNAGMMAMKLAFINLAKSIKTHALDARIVMVYHDELQIICRPKDAPLVQQLAEQAIFEGGNLLGLRVPLKGEAKIGDSWASTH